MSIGERVGAEATFDTFSISLNELIARLPRCTLPNLDVTTLTQLQNLE
jgi:hypothetical protein